MHLTFLDEGREITVLDRREELTHLIAIVTHYLHLHPSIIQVLHPSRHIEA